MSFQFMESPAQTLFWIRVVMVMTAAMFPAIFLLAATIPFTRLGVSRRVVMFVGVETLVVQVLSLTSLVFSAVGIKDRVITPVPGLAMPVYALHTLAYLGLTVFLLVRKIRRLTGVARKQITFVVLGIVATFVLATFTSFILVVVFKISDLVIIGPTYSLIMVGAMAYAIARHRFLDISVLVVRSVVFSLLVVVLGSIYVLISVLASELVFSQNTFANRVVVSAISALIIVFLFQPLRRVLEKLTDTVFYKGGYDSQKLLAELGHIMASSLLLDDLVGLSMKRLLEKLKVTYGEVVVFTKSGTPWVWSPKRGEGLRLSVTQKLIKGGRMMIFEELEESPDKETLRAENIALVMPLIVKDELIGGVVLGPKASGDVYSIQDINLFSILEPELAVAVKNALAYYEISQFNVTLQEEIAKATAELRTANGKLKELDKLKDEFISIASHELRSPAAVIKNYLWSVLNGKGKIDKEDREDVQKAYVANSRLVDLVNDLLDVSRIESGKLEMVPEEFDMVELVGTVGEEYSPRAKDKKIKLEVVKKVAKAGATADKNKMHQLLANLTDNAIKFTPEGGRVTMTVNVRDRGVGVSVADTGIGIAGEDLARLFTKFGRVDTTASPLGRVPGTGLGLYVSKKIAELSGGKLEVTSQVGKGSIFELWLPGKM